MKTTLLSLLLALFALCGEAKTIELQLWDAQHPVVGANAMTQPENTDERGRITCVSVPTLTVYIADKPNGLAVVACPGGAYRFLSGKSEGGDMAPWYNEQGITYAVLKYRLPNGGHYEATVADVHRAMTLMREHAKEWGIAKVGIQGNSAGGHLASTAATHYTAETRPDFQVLIYPVITMRPVLTHKGSHDNLLGARTAATLEWEYSNELHVTPDTPKAFIVHCYDDKVVDPRNSIGYYEALLAAGVESELLLLPNGGHGWGFFDTFPHKAVFTAALCSWLNHEVLGKK